MKLPISPIRAVRLLFQIGIAAAALTAGIRLAMGVSLSSVEKYCPFGGIETAWSFLTHQSFSCAAGELNVALFVALIGLTLIARKAFCSWVCPVGATSEWIAALVRRFRKGDLPGSASRLEGGRPIMTTRTSAGVDRGHPEGASVHGPGRVRERLRLPLEPPRRLDRALRWLRLPVLIVILFFTWRTGELVFRGYDPYYILFSAHGHDVKTWSYAIMAGVLVLTTIVPMAWCRYLCPLGVTLWPFSAIGRLRLKRFESRCTGCGACTRACPHGIPVAQSVEVRSGECTLCLECAEACPSQGALEMRLEGLRQ